MSPVERKLEGNELREGCRREAALPDEFVLGLSGRTVAILSRLPAPGECVSEWIQGRTSAGLRLEFTSPFHSPHSKTGSQLDPCIGPILVAPRAECLAGVVNSEAETSIFQTIEHHNIMVRRNAYLSED